MKQEMKKYERTLRGSHLIFSGMNSACPNCKGRRAVKNIREEKEILERIRNQASGKIKK